MLSFADDIETLLPSLRRYARAMTGDQTEGDVLAERTLRALINVHGAERPPHVSKVDLFRVFHDVRRNAPQPKDGVLDPTEARAHVLLSKLTPGSREALLLRAFEEFSDAEIAEVMQIDVARVPKLIETARAEISQELAGHILIIEDEARVAEQLETILIDMGHTVIGQAPRHADAVDLVASGAPDLILSDIQLAEGGDGIEAVSEILDLHPNVPVVFVTGFPERLLTGEAPEPVFLITKPFSTEQVRSAVSQAMFFTDRRGG